MSSVPFFDDRFAPGRDWVAAMNVYDGDTAPTNCGTGFIGLATQATPPFTSTCTAALTDGSLKPVSFWRPVLDYYLEFEYNRKLETVFQASHTHNSPQLYSLGNNVDSYTQAWIATSDNAYLTTVVGIIEDILSTAKPNNQLASQIQGVGATYPDTFLSWDTFGMSSLGFKTAGGQSPQNEAQFYKQVLYTCASAKRLGVTGTLATRLEAIRSWVEVNGFEKWWHRGVPPAVPEDEAYLLLEQVNHFDGYSRWASITMLLLYLCEGSSANLTHSYNLASLQTCNTKLVAGFVSTRSPFYHKGLRPNMRNHPVDAAAWWWNRFFDGVTTGSGDDVSHSNHLVRYIVDSNEFGMTGTNLWPSADLDRLRYTFNTRLWNGVASNPMSAFAMLGGTQYVNDWLQDGWFALGRTNQAFAALLQNKRPWPSNYWSQHYASIMRNAHEHGFN
jgi:hypothetical protein